MYSKVFNLIKVNKLLVTVLECPRLLTGMFIKY